MTLNLNWTGEIANSTWAIKVRNKQGDLKVTMTNRIDFAEAASDAYLFKNNLNAMNRLNWKIESISLVEDINEGKN